jgi:hypothetical protein
LNLHSEFKTLVEAGMSDSSDEEDDANLFKSLEFLEGAEEDKKD